MTILYTPKFRTNWLKTWPLRSSIYKEFTYHFLNIFERLNVLILVVIQWKMLTLKSRIIKNRYILQLFLGLGAWGKVSVLNSTNAVFDHLSMRQNVNNIIGIIWTGSKEVAPGAASGAHLPFFLNSDLCLCLILIFELAGPLISSKICALTKITVEKMNCRGNRFEGWLRNQDVRP